MAVCVVCTTQQCARPRIFRLRVCVYLRCRCSMSHNPSRHARRLPFPGAARDCAPNDDRRLVWSAHWSSTFSRNLRDAQRAHASRSCPMRRAAVDTESFVCAPFLCLCVCVNLPIMPDNACTISCSRCACPSRVASSSSCHVCMHVQYGYIAM